MDPNQPLQSQPQIQLPQVPAPKPANKWNAILFLEIGLFEIGFVLLLLTLIFGTLVYFHVLHIPAFTNYLSYLPQIKKQTAPVVVSQLPSGPFTYNAPAAYTALENFTKGTLTDTFLPKSASASADPFIFIENKNVFTSPWNFTQPTLGNGTASLTLVPSTDTPFQYKILLRTSTDPILQVAASTSTQAAALIVHNVFRADLSHNTWTCDQNICTLSKKTPIGIASFVIVLSQAPNGLETYTINACLNPNITDQTISCSE